jgi:hypothetical protein
MPDSEAFTRNIAGIHPVSRAGRPEEVAALVSFLASDEAWVITGQIYAVDGGRMTKRSPLSKLLCPVKKRHHPFSSQAFAAVGNPFWIFAEECP